MNNLLKKEKLTKAEEPRVLIQDWYKNSQSRERVIDRIEKTLDSELPESYSRAIFSTKLNVTYNFVYDYAQKGEKWVSA
ncbi:MAG: hypothetical protein L3J41_14890 [Melioribacteraceae bacterium]|nr:hypothetical protein [Melioribacteraceae bacterium]